MDHTEVEAEAVVEDTTSDARPTSRSMPIIHPTHLDRELPMPQVDDEDNTVYKVVVNHEEQYSIWPKDRENALGWFDEGTAGSKQECLDHIEVVWTDMRPLSLRRHMQQQTA